MSTGAATCRWRERAAKSALWRWHASTSATGADADSAARPEVPTAPVRRFGFVMELQAGLRTVYSNWRAVVDADPGIEPTWVPITYHEPRGAIERLGFVPASLRAAARSY